jgi:hypothetical protein
MAVENSSNDNGPLELEATVGAQIITILALRFWANMDPVFAGVVGTAVVGGARLAVAGFRRRFEINDAILGVDNGHPR